MLDAEEFIRNVTFNVTDIGNVSHDDMAEMIKNGVGNKYEFTIDELARKFHFVHETLLAYQEGYAYIFNKMLSIAHPIVKHYRSDLIYDFHFILEYGSEMDKFYWFLRESGTDIYRPLLKEEEEGRVRFFKNLNQYMFIFAKDYNGHFQIIHQEEIKKSA